MPFTDCFESEKRRNDIGAKQIYPGYGKAQACKTDLLTDETKCHWLGQSRVFCFNILNWFLLFLFLPRQVDFKLKCN